MPQWASKHGGMVISATIDKYCYISCRRLLPFYDYKYRLVYSQTEVLSDIQDIRHRGVKGVLSFIKEDLSLEIHHDGDLPARAGLGSSSAFTVGLLHVIQAMLGGQRDKMQLAKDAIFIEQKINGEVVGSQDQVAASFGGLNKIVFCRDGGFEVTQIPLQPEQLKLLNEHILLMYTGIQRIAPKIERDKVLSIDKKMNEYRDLMDITEAAENIFLDDNFSPLEIGDLLHESWLIKKSLSNKVTNETIDEIYQTARSAGAVGGKILGAGGGGFMAFLVEPSKREAVKMALAPLVSVEFKFENEGSSVLKLN